MLISGLLVSFGLFVGRLSGFVREAYIASQFGATEQADLIIIFLSAPDILVNLLVGGALGMALIPEFKQLDQMSSIRLYQQVLVVLIVMFSAISLVAYFYAGYILSLLAPGLNDGTIEKYRNTFAITFIAIPLTVATGVTAAFLHYKGKFLVPALGTFVFNIVLIISLYMANKLEPKNVLFLISLGVCLGAVIRWVTQLLDSRTLPFNRVFLKKCVINSSLVKRYFYCVLTGGMIFLLPVVARAIASQSGVGELSLVNYAIKLVEFPLGVVLTVFTIVLFPKFSSLSAQGKNNEFLVIFKQTLLTVIAISFAIYVPLNHFSLSFVYLVYDWGGLTLGQLDKVSAYFNHVSLTLPFQGINALLIAVIVSRKDALSPLICSTGLTAIFIMIGYGFVVDISAVFNLMIITYAVLSIVLLVIILVKHRVSFVSNTFVFDFFKLLGAAIIYYWLLSQVTFLQLSIWRDLFISGVSSLVFLVVCVVLSHNIRQIIKVQKGS